MSSWKSIIAGRENDVHYLLKELVDTLDNNLLKKLPETSELEDAIKATGSARDKLRALLQKQFEEMEKNTRKGKLDSKDYYDQLFPALKSGVNEFEIAIKEVLKENQIEANKTRNIKLSDAQMNITAAQILTEVKETLEEKIEANLGGMEYEESHGMDEEKVDSKIKEYEKKIKNYKKKEKTIPKLKEQIEQLKKVPSLSETKEKDIKDRTKKIAEILELPIEIKGDRILLDEKREFLTDLNNKQRKRDKVRLTLKYMKQEKVPDWSSLLDSPAERKRSGKKWPERVPAIDSETGKPITAKDVKELQDEWEKNNTQKISQVETNLSNLEKEIVKLGKLATRIKGFRELIGINVKTKITSLENKIRSIENDLFIEQEKLELFHLKVKESGVGLTEKQKRTIRSFFKNLDKEYPKGNFSKEELKRKIAATDLKVLQKVREDTLKAFDNTTESINERIKERFAQKESDAKRAEEGKGKTLDERVKLKPKDRISVAFSEIFTEIQGGKDALTQLKEILNEKGFKQYLAILDKNIVMEGSLKEFKDLSKKEKNDYVLDNLPQFKTYYTRLISVLDDLLQTAEKGSDAEKIKTIQEVMASLQSKFKNKLPTSDKEYSKRKEGIKFATGKTSGLELEGEKIQVKDLPKQLAEEERRIYEYIFLSKGPETAKSLYTNEVSAYTKTFWTDLQAGLEGFTKGITEGADEKTIDSLLLNFINKSNLHTVDILNVIGTKRNNKVRSDTLARIESKKEKGVKQDLTGKKKDKYEEDRKTKTVKPSQKESEGYRVKKAEETQRKKFEAVEDWTKAYRELALGKHSDEIDSQNKKLHDYFTKDLSGDEDNNMFAYIDANKKGEVTLRGFAYHKKDTGYSEIKNKAVKILKYLETEKESSDGKKFTVLNLINQLVRKLFKYKAGFVRDEQKRQIRARFVELEQTQIKSMKLDELFQIPLVMKRRMKRDNIKLRGEMPNLFAFASKLPEGDKIGFYAERMKNTLDDDSAFLDDMTEREEIMYQIWKKISVQLEKFRDEWSKKEISLKDRPEEKQWYKNRLAEIIEETKNMTEIHEVLKETIDKELKEGMKELLFYQERLEEVDNADLSAHVGDTEVSREKVRETRQKAVNAAKEFIEKRNKKLKIMEGRADKSIKYFKDDYAHYLKQMESGDFTRTKRGLRRKPLPKED